jgi:hypothetical protein
MTTRGRGVDDVSVSPGRRGTAEPSEGSRATHAGATETDETRDRSTSADTDVRRTRTVSRAATRGDAFDDLLSETEDSEYGPVAPVNIPEAEQFRRMYTVGNYVLARVPDALTALNSRLTSNTNGAGPVFTSKSELIEEHGAEIDRVLKMVNEEFNSGSSLRREIRAWFDLGTDSAPNVNTRFKTLFREFATICADDLFGVDPELIESSKRSFDPETLERLLRLYRDAKRRLIDLVESMSDSGTLGSDRLLAKWAEIVSRSLKVLREAGQFVATDDSDKKHVWSVVADLAGQSKAAVIPFVVHAREGGELLGDAIVVYESIQKDDKLANEDPDYLKKLFGKPDVVFEGTGLSAARQLRANATLALANWPWG